MGLAADSRTFVMSIQDFTRAAGEIIAPPREWSMAAVSAPARGGGDRPTFGAGPRHRRDRDNPVKFALRPSDDRRCMSLHYPAPMSNNKRQRLFRKRHPGYFNKYNHRKRQRLTPEQLAAYAAIAAADAAAHAATPAEPPAQQTPAPMALLTRPYQLCLPAPVVDPTMAAINELKTKIKLPLAA
jgi:hypothetical protein